jgi:glucoamylase
MSPTTAPGQPGIPPRWTSSAKSGVGTAASGQSRVWFTLSHGIVDEVYYPRIDQANTRDLGFLVTDRSDFFSEEKRQTTNKITSLKPGVPGYRLVNTCMQGRYRITKTIITDPVRDVLLQQVQFEPLQGTLKDYALYVLLAPHIDNAGNGNNGQVDQYKGIPMLFASREDTTLALACSTPFSGMSCGYVGYSDGWQDINAHERMTWFYDQAPGGNIALTGEIDLAACDGKFILALAFGRNAAEAGQHARAALLQDFDHVLQLYGREWQQFQKRCIDYRNSDKAQRKLYRVSTAVLRTHQAKQFGGGMIASLSIPWGTAKSDDDLGGYHLVWPRDLVESAGGLLAAGDVEGARQTLVYLMCTQDGDGHWPQNMWLDGTPYWTGIQMDETTFPILLADSLRRLGALDGLNPWPMIRCAASFLVRNGPVTGQDRWEEDGGYSPFTLAVEIAGLLAAADFADEAGEKDVATYLRQTADAWNDNVERWTYVTDTDLAHQVGVEGYYVRIAPQEVSDAASPVNGFVPIKNRPPGQSSAPLIQIVSPDALALVRFGLRAADDPRIENTVRAIDTLLKTQTATGPVWHRYNQDGYGEHEDGSAFDGTGVGRGWPLLAAERAHYELAKGNKAEAEHLLEVIAAQTSPGGLIPEQVWDAEDMPDKELFNGHPSGSAMPLVWAHAEYIKLVRSLHDGQVFDLPPQPKQRYQVDKVVSPYLTWRFNHKIRDIPAGKLLRIELLAPATVQWTTDNWTTTYDARTSDTTLGMQIADLSTDKLSVGTEVAFTFFWLEDSHWEGTNFAVSVTGPNPS